MKLSGYCELRNSGQTSDTCKKMHENIHFLIQDPALGGARGRGGGLGLGSIQNECPGRKAPAAVRGRGLAQLPHFVAPRAAPDRVKILSSLLKFQSVNLLQSRQLVWADKQKVFSHVKTE
jgi:hypothetical protein